MSQIKKYLRRAKETEKMLEKETPTYHIFSSSVGYAIPKMVLQMMERKKKSNEVSDMRICRFNLMNETKPTDEQEHCRKSKQKTSDEPSM